MLLSFHISEVCKSGKPLPCPTQILGGLTKKEEVPVFILPEDDNDHDEDEEKPCLRQTQDYADFLYLFAKTVLTAESFKNKSSTKLLSAYMPINLEAFAVLTYVNR
jgi:hypothetical protein